MNSNEAATFRVTLAILKPSQHEGGLVNRKNFHFQ